MLRLRGCAGSSQAAVSRGYCLAVVRGFLTALPSLAAEHKLWGVSASAVAARGPSGCDFRLRSCTGARLLCAMWDLPGPGTKPVSPALARRFSTTEPSGTPSCIILEYTLRWKFKWNNLGIPKISLHSYSSAPSYHASTQNSPCLCSPHNFTLYTVKSIDGWAVKLPVIFRIFIQVIDEFCKFSSTCTVSNSSIMMEAHWQRPKTYPQRAS